MWIRSQVSFRVKQHVLKKWPKMVNQVAGPPCVKTYFRIPVRDYFLEVVGEHLTTNINSSYSLLQFLAFDVWNNVSKTVAWINQQTTKSSRVFLHVVITAQVSSWEGEKRIKFNNIRHSPITNHSQVSSLSLPSAWLMLWQSSFHSSSCPNTRFSCICVNYSSLYKTLTHDLSAEAHSCMFTPHA